MGIIRDTICVRVLYVVPSRGYDDTTLGLSLSKKTIFGWKFISRCNPSIENGSMVQCRWYDEDKDRYKGTVVVNYRLLNLESKVLYVYVIEKFLS